MTCEDANACEPRGVRTMRPETRPFRMSMRSTIVFDRTVRLDLWRTRPGRYAIEAETRLSTRQFMGTELTPSRSWPFESPTKGAPRRVKAPASALANGAH